MGQKPFNSMILSNFLIEENLGLNPAPPPPPFPTCKEKEKKDNQHEIRALHTLKSKNL